jgi:hypothetical protein
MVRSFVRILAGIVGTAFLTLLVSCGGGSGSTSDFAKVRFFNASPTSTGLDILIDNKTISTSLGYPNSTGYLKISPGSRAFKVVQTGTSTTAIDSTLSLSGNTQYTELLVNFPGSLSSVQLTDDQTEDASNAKIRFVNASPNIGSINIYLVPAGTTTLTGQTPLTGSPIGFVGNSGGNSGVIPYSTHSPASYVIYVTSTGGFEYFHTSTFNFAAKQNRTFVLVNSPSSGYQFASPLSDLN